MTTLLAIWTIGSIFFILMMGFHPALKEMRDRDAAKYGNFWLAFFLVWTAFMWPFLLPVTLIRRINAK